MVDEVIWAPRKGASGEDVYHWPDGGRVLSGVRAWTELSGTVAKNGTFNVTGIGTHFLTEVAAGDWLVIPGGGGVEERKVDVVLGDLSLKVLAANPFAFTASGQIASLSPDLTEVNASTGMMQIYGEIERLSALMSSVPVLPDYHDVLTTKRILGATITDLQPKITNLTNYVFDPTAPPILPTSAGLTTLLLGKASKSAGSNLVVGDAYTRFTQQLVLGDRIQIPHLLPAPGVETKFVGAIADDAHLTTTAIFVRTAALQNVTRLRTLVFRKKIMETHLYELRKGLTNYPPVVEDRTLAYGTPYPATTLYQDIVLTGTDENDHPAARMTFSLVNTPGTPLTGTVTKNGTVNVVGLGTAFTTELVVGQFIEIPGGTSTEVRTISAITDNTHLTVSAAFTTSAAGQTARLKPGTFVLQGSTVRTSAKNYARTLRFTPNLTGRYPAGASLAFTYKLNDGLADSNIGTVTLTLNPPVATATADIHIPDGTALVTYPIVLTATDIEDHNVNQLRFVVLQSPGVTLAGTVSKTNGSNIVVGSGTDFENDVYVGQTIEITGGGLTETRVIAGITDVTHLTVTGAFNRTASGRPLRIEHVGGFAGGTTVRSSAGNYTATLTYMPNAGGYPDPFIGPEDMTYMVTDGVNDSAAVKLDLTVEALKVVFWNGGDSNYHIDYHVDSANEGTLYRGPEAVWPPVGAISRNVGSYLAGAESPGGPYYIYRIMRRYVLDYRFERLEDYIDSQSAYHWNNVFGSNGGTFNLYVSDPPLTPPFSAGDWGHLDISLGSVPDTGYNYMGDDPISNMPVKGVINLWVVGDEATLPVTHRDTSFAAAYYTTWFVYTP